MISFPIDWLQQPIRQERGISRPRVPQRGPEGWAGEALLQQEQYSQMHAERGGAPGLPAINSRFASMTCVAETERRPRPVALPFRASPLEVETDFSRDRPRRDVVRAAERREEVVEGVVVGQVDHGHAGAPFVAVAAEEVVVSDR